MGSLAFVGGVVDAINKKREGSFSHLLPSSKIIKWHCVILYSRGVDRIRHLIYQIFQGDSKGLSKALHRLSLGKFRLPVLNITDGVWFHTSQLCQFPNRIKATSAPFLQPCHHNCSLQKLFSHFILLTITKPKSIQRRTTVGVFSVVPLSYPPRIDIVPILMLLYIHNTQLCKSQLYQAPIKGKKNNAGISQRLKLTVARVLHTIVESGSNTLSERYPVLDTTTSCPKNQHFERLERLVVSKRGNSRRNTPMSAQKLPLLQEVAR